MAAHTLFISTSYRRDNHPIIQSRMGRKHLTCTDGTCYTIPPSEKDMPSFIETLKADGKFEEYQEALEKLCGSTARRELADELGSGVYHARPEPEGGDDE